MGDNCTYPDLLLRSKRNHLTESIGRPPDPSPQTTQLHNLRMVDKDIYIDPEFTNIPIENSRISRYSASQQSHT